MMLGDVSSLVFDFRPRDGHDLPRSHRTLGLRSYTRTRAMFVDMDNTSSPPLAQPDIERARHDLDPSGACLQE